MKKSLVLLLAFTLICSITACGNREKIENKDENYAEESHKVIEDESENVEIEDEDYSETIESSVSSLPTTMEEAIISSKSKYADYMADINHLSADSSKTADVEEFVISIRNDSEMSFGKTEVDFDATTAFFKGNMTETDSESGSDYSLIKYDSDTEGLRVESYKSGKSEWWYRPLDNDMFEPTIYVTTFDGILKSIRLNGDYTGRDYEADISINELNANSTLDDVLNVLGMPDEAYTSSSYRGNDYLVTYRWKTWNNFTEAELYIEFIVDTDSDGNNFLKVQVMDFEQKIYK